MQLCCCTVLYAIWLPLLQVMVLLVQLLSLCRGTARVRCPDRTGWMDGWTATCIVFTGVASSKVAAGATCAIIALQLTCCILVAHAYAMICAVCA
jgi:hypothetical protein